MLKYFLISLIVILADQISKVYIKLSFDYHSSINILGDLLKFTYIENPGIVFGLEVNSIVYYLITFLSICIIYYIIFLMKSLYYEQQSNIALISFSFILGGAIGNAIDRFFVIFNLFNYQGVIDFIDVGIKSYRFYIFNIADSAVTIGILLFIYYNYYIDSKNTVI